MLFKVSLKQIQTYSKCPRQFGFQTLHNITKTRQLSDRDTIKDLIKQSYLNRTQHGYSPQWETIKSRVDKHCFKNVDIKNKVSFDTAYKRSLNLLKILHNWYYKYFSKDTHEGLVNLPLSYQVDKTIVYGTLDLALLDKKYQIIPVIFDDYKLSIDQLYNDMYIKSLLWLVYKETQIDPKHMFYWSITDNTVIRNSIFNKTDMDIIEKYVNFIVRGIEYKVFYPSVNEQCNTCEYKNICNI